MQLHPIWKNKISYQESLKIQEDLKRVCLQNHQDSIVGFECPTTVTLGLRGNEEDLILSREELAQKGIPVISIHRGGQATLHSLGQLVMYPVVDIKKNNMRVRDFITSIEKRTQQVLEDLGVSTHKEEGQAGLFTSKGKIAFFGLHVSRGVSQHGLSINVCNNLNLFSYIRSCGQKDRPHDCISNYHPKITIEEVFRMWVQKTERSQFADG